MAPYVDEIARPSAVERAMADFRRRHATTWGSAEARMVQVSPTLAVSRPVPLVAPSWPFGWHAWTDDTTPVWGLTRRAARRRWRRSYGRR